MQLPKIHMMPNASTQIPICGRKNLGPNDYGTEVRKVFDKALNPCPLCKKKLKSKGTK